MNIRISQTNWSMEKTIEMEIQPSSSSLMGTSSWLACSIAHTSKTWIWARCSNKTSWTCKKEALTHSATSKKPFIRRSRKPRSSWTRPMYARWARERKTCKANISPKLGGTRGCLNNRATPKTRTTKGPFRLTKWRRTKTWWTNLGMATLPRINLCLQTSTCSSRAKPNPNLDPKIKERPSMPGKASTFRRTTISSLGRSTHTIKHSRFKTWLTLQQQWAKRGCQSTRKIRILKFKSWICKS